MIPRRVLARKKDEAEPAWWNTDDNRNYKRWGNPGDWAKQDDLILVNHGNNDPVAVAAFPLQNLERFQPASRP